MRPSREEIHMRTALMWSKRSLCKQPNREVGCVITDCDMRKVLSIGYNGPSRKLSNNYCRGKTPCGCLHAEMNAVAMCSEGSSKIAFVTLEPCELCAQLLIQASVCKVFYLNEYREHKGVELLTSSGIEVFRMNLDEVGVRERTEKMRDRLLSKIDCQSASREPVLTWRQVRFIVEEFFKDELSR